MLRILLMRSLFRIILFLLLIFANSGVFASVSESDSLIQRWYSIKDSAHDTTKIQLLKELGRVIKYSSPDSAIKFLNIALELAEKNNFTNEKAHVISRMGGA